MSKAEEAALRAYPEKIIEHVEEPGFVVKRDLNRFDRNVYIQGYEQAEKDLALTWEDAVTIVTIAMDIIGDGKITVEQNIYTEVLRRFNSQREKK